MNRPTAPADTRASARAAPHVDYRFVAYPGAVHAFTVPEATALGQQFDLPLAYDETADAQGWMELEKFLRDVF